MKMTRNSLILSHEKIKRRSEESLAHLCFLFYIVGISPYQVSASIYLLLSGSAWVCPNLLILLFYSWTSRKLSDPGFCSKIHTAPNCSNPYTLVSQTGKIANTYQPPFRQSFWPFSQLKLCQISHVSDNRTRAHNGRSVHAYSSELAATHHSISHLSTFSIVTIVYVYLVITTPYPCPHLPQPLHSPDYPPDLEFPV